MTDMPPRQQFSDQQGSANAQAQPQAHPQAAPQSAPQRPPQAAPQAAAQPSECASQPIGVVLEIAGSGSMIALDLQRLTECADDCDPSVALAGQVGSQVKIKTADGWLLASVRDQKQDRRSEGILASIDFMGEGTEEKLTGKISGFRRGVTRYPIPGALIYPATTPDLKQIYASDGRSAIQIGTVYPTDDIRAGVYIDAMLGKHFALLGSTGTGKSTSAALILHRICQAAPKGHIVMVDPHGEYSAAFKNTGTIFDVSNLQMPYWLLNFEEHCEVILTSQGNDRQADADILAKCLLKARGKNRLAEQLGKITVDSPIPYLLSDLSTAIADEMGKLDKATNTAPFMRLKTKLEELKGDPRYQFMFSGMLVGDTMAEFISKIFRMPSDGKPISIIDVSGVPSDITSTVVAVLSRMVFDFAIWGREEKTAPILLVCEEAHRYVPCEKNADGSSVGRILSRIAKEGRKYGISLGLITQRPSDLAEGVLSQCGTIISMRLNNDRDQAFVKAAMPEGARGFLDSIPALRNRECIICGEGVAIPIRVSFDNLEESKRPASEDPSFTDLWNQSGGEEDAVLRTVQRWRAQGK
ncbi:ATP-binding protein [Paraurantiacibacter namhicola]|uniref:AAA-like domain protein n=1 Tax=Paraurantiacibacter namhicola TaxID=645517 RepID=A0A1C7DB47_9SPHN|nr:ATP-binding protein [Paraurantiacibacter namhicola]ANU08637.1 AAA-like domain protein [Paraurantiacibacter namhicola]